MVIFHGYVSLPEGNNLLRPFFSCFGFLYGGTYGKLLVGLRFWTWGKDGTWHPRQDAEGHRGQTARRGRAALRCVNLWTIHQQPARLPQASD